jgi:hypothetical protein
VEASATTADRRTAATWRDYSEGLATHSLLLLILGAVTLLRLRLIRDTSYPTGLDGGNWLAFGHSIFGEHIRSSTLLYPPIVPLLAVVAEHALGPYAGLQWLAFASATAPPLGMYVLLYTWGLGWRAAVLAGFLAACAATGEAMAWGGYPQLIGLGILPVFVLTLEHFLTSRRAWDALLPAILTGAALATSDLIGPFTVLVGVFYLLIRYPVLIAKRTGNSIPNVLLGMTLSVLASLPFLPIYGGLLTGVAANERVKSIGHVSVVRVVSAFVTATNDLPTFWQVGLALGLLAALILVVRPQNKLAAASASLLVPCLILLALTGENRLVYILPAGIIVGLGAWWDLIARRSISVRRSLNAFMVAWLVVDVLIGTLYYREQRAVYEILNPGLIAGLSQLSSRSQPQQLIAVSATIHNWPIGWWVEGAAERRSVYAGDPVLLNYADEIARNAVANDIFAAGGIAQSRRKARIDGVAYLFVDKRWSGYDAWVNGGTVIDRTGIVFENESTLIVSTGG